MSAPILCWLRRDLRLHDHPMLRQAADSGRPVIPVFILDPETEAIGAAAKWRLGEGVASFANTLDGIGSRLILRRGKALDVLRDLVQETGTDTVWWGRLYDPDAIVRDTAVKEGLRADGCEARSFPGHVLFEPWTVETTTGGPYRVYSPFWRSVRNREVGEACAGLRKLSTPANWPGSDALDDWALGAAMNRGAAVVAKYACIGEAAARRRLDDFLDGPVDDYAEDRNLPGIEATSRLSENLTYGEISPRAVWLAAMAQRAEGRGGKARDKGLETFLKEVVWREFAYHLIFHFPHIVTGNWREEWDDFPWRGDSGDAEAWRRGLTGEPFVDAAMREMFVTGTMHNRARMIAASYLTKHLMTHWQVGMAWFADCLTDWDPASNAMGWQWVAGSGPDAAPYFRVFNPETQAEKFDRKGTYRRTFLYEGQDEPPEQALDYLAAAPRSWRLGRDDRRPEKLIDLSEGRSRALEAYESRKG
ncbi:cryptochrome/photolyase family protein [Acidimangrovimonas sediminis]|uniref:cryptochrome/photolyase family protein n=1 Tax=Acidimangrovimonas sediminis TaxID=2056283 RepID=UPI000C802957|nr:deoxyribodipyrimidine photo-lyase [Acidimangrovimonas sediminis]